MLDQLKPAKGSVRKRQRVGRGVGSGAGKTCGRGSKGQGSRSGGGVRPGFEGGQMPLQRRLPKRGFTNPFRKEYSVVNLKDLSRITDVDVVDPDLMIRFRLARKGLPVKILAVGEIDRPVTIRAHKFSASAAEKIAKAGGSIEII